MYFCCRFIDLMGLPNNKRDFFAVFIDKGTKPFVRELDSHLAGIIV